MDATTSLTGSRAVIGEAVDALQSIQNLLHQARGEELAALVTLCDTLAVTATQARTAAVAEAVRRDEIPGTVPGWIREHAPSLRQGGAGQLGKLVTEATRRSGLSAVEGDGLDPESPTGVVWEASLQPPVVTGQVRPVIGAGNALAVLSEMRALQPQLRPEAVPTVTRALVELVVEWGPSHMRQLRPRLLAEFGLEGEIDALHDKLARAAYLSSPQVESGSLTEYRMALTPEQSAVLEAAIGPLAAPSPNPQTGEKDLRPSGQRRVEALAEICQAAISTHHAAGGEGPSGAYAALHVSMQLADLRRLTGCATVLDGSAYSLLEPPASSPPPVAAADGVHSSGPGRVVPDTWLSGEVLASSATGTLLAPTTLRRLACEADLIPHVLGSAGELLDQGREVRLFNRAQRRALARRDGACTYPGCDRPAAWSRAHHVLHWWDGGDTGLDNAALLCGRHHTTVHARRLWAEVRSTPDRHGRYVVWDLVDGSYDEELRRRRAERASHDPPPLTAHRVATLLSTLRDRDHHERAWASELLAWHDSGVSDGPGESMTCASGEHTAYDEWPLFEPLIWDDAAHAFVA